MCAKWDGKKVWDCSGLFRGAWRALLKYKSGGATTIFKTWCIETGPIETMPDEAGLAVFKGSGTSMSHIGLYTGNGMVVDARGSAKGVLYEPIGAVAWTHWGRLADVDYEGHTGAGSGSCTVPPTDALYRAKVVNVKTGLNFRTSPQLIENTIMLLKKDSIVEVLEDNVGGGLARVRFGNVTGYCTRSYLLQLEE